MATDGAMLRVLVTNDDGIQADGLRALAAQLALRCQVLVIAPDSPQGAKSHSVTLHKPVRIESRDDYVLGADPARLQALACSGTPADCVMLGALHLWKDSPPHLVLSGINDGENVAQDLSYSGTVGGALEGLCCGVPSVALSNAGYLTTSPADAALAADLALSVLLYGRVYAHHEKLAAAWRLNGEPDGDELWQIPRPAGGEPPTAYPVPGDWYPPGLQYLPCLNINLPAAPVEEIRGIRWTRSGRREYRDVVQPGTDPRGRKYYWVAGDRVLMEDEQAGTDTHGLAHGYITVTPMSYDRTNHEDLRRLRAWSLERG